MRTVIATALSVLLWIVCALASNSWAAPQPAVTLGTNVPFARRLDDAQMQQPGSHSVANLSCIFAHLPYRLKIKVQPWRRAQQDVLGGVSAGFFTAMPDPRVDSYATLSYPLVLEKWYWFSRSKTIMDDLPGHLRVGAILGSHQQRWLALEHIPTTLLAQQLPQLLKQLFAGRIDVILTDQKQFEQAAAFLHINPARYHSRFSRYVPLGVYFGKNFLSEHPGFLPHFNRYVDGCVPGKFALSHAEQQRITTLLSPLLQRWLTEPDILAALKQHNKQYQHISREAIQRLDTLWRSAYAKTDWSTLADMLNPAAVKTLQRWRNQHAFINEIILTGRHGLNLATSPLASDFWQGDEAKFQQGYQLKPGQWFFDEVVYDASTHRFQVQVSLAVYADSATPVGVLTLGINIQRALAESEG